MRHINDTTYSSSNKIEPTETKNIIKNLPYQPYV